MGMSNRKANSRKGRKGPKGRKGGNCGAQGLMGGSSWSLGTAGMYGGNPMESTGVVGMDSLSSFASNAASVGGDPVPTPVPTKVGGRSRRFRASRMLRMPRMSRSSRKSKRVFPNNIFRNMF